MLVVYTQLITIFDTRKTEILLQVRNFKGISI